LIAKARQVKKRTKERKKNTYQVVVQAERRARATATVRPVAARRNATVERLEEPHLERLQRSGAAVLLIYHARKERGIKSEEKEGIK
jgi:hypothetical protein